MTQLTTFEERGDALPRFVVQGALVPAELDDAIEQMIALRDEMDGDPDHEDATDLEDEGIAPSTLRNFASSAGCEFSDVGESAWIEWTTLRGSQKRGPNIASIEDDEDDDPSGQYDEDYYTGKRPRGRGPGCLISDSDFEHDGREDEDEYHPDYDVDQSAGPLHPSIAEDKGLRAPHLARVRRERCQPIRIYGQTEYRLVAREQ